MLHRMKKKQKQELSRFLPCPVCHRSFPSYSIHDHVNICLDSTGTGHTQSSPSTSLPSPSCNSERLHPDRKDYDQFSSSSGGVEKDATLDDDLKSSLAAQGCPNPLLVFSAALASTGPLKESSEIHLTNTSSYETADERDEGARMPEDETFRFLRNTGDCRQTNRVATGSAFVDIPTATEIIGPELPVVEEMERGAQDATALPEHVSDKSRLGLQIFQVSMYNSLVFLFLMPF